MVKEELTKQMTPEEMKGICRRVREQEDGFQRLECGCKPYKVWNMKMTLLCDQHLLPDPEFIGVRHE